RRRPSRGARAPDRRPRDRPLRRRRLDRSRLTGPLPAPTAHGTMTSAGARGVRTGRLKRMRLALVVAGLLASGCQVPVTLDFPVGPLTYTVSTDGLQQQIPAEFR